MHGLAQRRNRETGIETHILDALLPDHSADWGKARENRERRKPIITAVNSMDTYTRQHPISLTKSNIALKLTLSL